MGAGMEEEEKEHKDQDRRRRKSRRRSKKQQLAFVSTLMWGSSRCNMVESDSVTADMNLEGSVQR